MKTALRSKVIFMFLLVSAAFSSAYAADAKPAGLVSGTVKDALTGLNLEYANVVLFKTADSSMVTGTITDAKGGFTIREVPYGEYYLVANFIGYRKAYMSGIVINAKTREIRSGELLLTPSTTGLSEVTVAGERPSVEYKIDKKVVNVAKNLNAAGGTASDALRNVPSVNVDADGNVSIRGNSNVTVLVDGRPTALSGNDLLKQTPASAVENIEVITNPSAKYDPEGTAGIINLIMKKQNRNGFNGIVNTSAGMGGKYSGDFNLNRRKDKVNYFLGGGASSRNFKTDQDMYRENYFNDTTQFIISETARKVYMTGYSLKGGADLFLSEKTTVNVNGDFGFSGFKRDFPNRYKVYSLPGEGIDYQLNENYFTLEGLYGSGNIGFQHKYAEKDHEISGNIFYSAWDGDRRENRTNSPADSNYNAGATGAEQNRALNNVVRNTLRMKMDYVRPSGKNSKLEAGYQGDLGLSDFTYIQDYFDDSQGIWVPDTVYTNEFKFRQIINSAYATYTTQIGSYELMGGLRFEMLDREISQETSGKNYDVKFHNIFPSFHVSRSWQSGHQLQFSYSRRVNRPQEWMLNPFPMYSDEYFASCGNPFLKPDFSSAFELNYMRTLKKTTLTTELFFRKATSSIGQGFAFNEEGKLYSTFDNMGNNYAYGLEFNANLSFYKWLNINAVASYYLQKIEAFEKYDIEESHSDGYNVQLIPRIILPTGTVIQPTFYYFGPATFEQGTSREFAQLDVSVRQEFLKKKLTVSIRSFNLFGMARNRYILEGPGFYLSQRLVQEKNMVTLALSYKINNYTRINRKTDQVEMDSGGM